MDRAPRYKRRHIEKFTPRSRARRSKSAVLGSILHSEPVTEWVDTVGVE